MVVTPSLGLAFVAGLASFLSPCVFALVPAYISYLGGRTAGGDTDAGGDSRWTAFSHGLAFVLGFSLVFVLFGALAGALGRVLYDLQAWIGRIGGLIVIIFGLHMIGVFRIPFLEYDTRVQKLPERRWGYLSSVLMGVFFSAGWSPCTGPILTAIATLVLQGGSILQGILLFSVYSLGLGIPFLVAAVSVGWVTTILRRYGKTMRYVEIGMGVVLVLVGALLMLGSLSLLANLGRWWSVDFGL